MRWLALQLADSAFPTGGFAHSGGIEAAVQLGALPDPAAMEAHLRALVEQAGTALLPLVAAVWDDPSRLAEVDAIADAWTTVPAANRASRAQGAALLHAAAALSPAVAELKAAVRARRQSAHAGPVAGSVYRLLGCDRGQALELALFTAMRTWVSAAVRLSALGPLEAQAMQARLAPALDAALAAGAAAAVDDLALVHPLAEVWAGHHDRLYSRLFAS